MFNLQNIFQQSQQYYEEIPNQIRQYQEKQQSEVIQIEKPKYQVKLKIQYKPIILEFSVEKKFYQLQTGLKVRQLQNVQTVQDKKFYTYVMQKVQQWLPLKCQNKNCIINIIKTMYGSYRLNFKNLNNFQFIGQIGAKQWHQDGPRGKHAKIYKMFEKFK